MSSTIGDIFELMAVAIGTYSCYQISQSKTIDVHFNGNNKKLIIKEKESDGENRLLIRKIGITNQ